MVSTHPPTFSYLQGKKTREEVKNEVLNKRQAARELKAQYRSEKLSGEDIQRVLDSIADAGT